MDATNTTVTTESLNENSAAVVNVGTTVINEDGQPRKRAREVEEEHCEEPAIKRFKVMSSEDTYKWKLPAEMAEYVNSHFQQFIPAKDVYESILYENPVPSNVDVPQAMDDFILPILKKSELAVDTSFSKIQQKLVNVLGPLSQVWQSIETAKNSDDAEVEFSLHDLAENIDKTIILLGQAFQASAYQRRYNALSAIMKDHKKVKETLREKADLLKQEHKLLFGEKFQSYVTETVKTRQKSEDLFKDLNREKPSQRRQPFRSGPPPENRQGKSSGGQRFVYTKRSFQGHKRYSLRKKAHMLTREQNKESVSESEDEDYLPNEDVETSEESGSNSHYEDEKKTIKERDVEIWAAQILIIFNTTIQWLLSLNLLRKKRKN